MSSEPLVVDVYFSFRSPYSYLALPQLVSWKSKYKNLQLRMQPILPLLVRKPDFFEKVNPKTHLYMKIDTRRVADQLGVPFKWFNPDPVPLHFDENGIHRMNEHQPYIYRLTYLGILAEEQGHGLEFAAQVAHNIWTLDNWDQGSHLAEAVQRAGLNLAELDQKLEQDWSRLEALEKEHVKALDAAGHWGVPTCVFNGEPFFGQDRLELLLWRLRQHGLEEVSDS
ncbi:DSBA oxidoreductase [Talaromyces proteolyticus]|uniref:Glutathione S-transferase kappa n=1 Tax=Talaromyces proteolyticus TaxID=1131652 RepID=A0AAD4KT31_9EURO|nr:DSBA oxidoreductase [Talaromyces proteolyticus]KAH8698731.1 DSBA oxidoreductase [Talaromyces proteolyticus]